MIVNAANPGLLGGGGVDGAIHRAGGPAILEECRAVKAGLPEGRLPRGRRWRRRRAGCPPAGWCTPRARSGRPRRTARRCSGSCYRESLRVADELGARSVAFPAISAGIYGWPLDDAARQAVAGVRSLSPDHVREVRFVLFDDAALAAFEAALSG